MNTSTPISLPAAHAKDANVKSVKGKKSAAKRGVTASDESSSDEEIESSDSENYSDIDNEDDTDDDFEEVMPTKKVRKFVEASV